MPENSTLCFVHWGRDPRTDKLTATEFICLDCVTPGDIIDGAQVDPNFTNAMCDRCGSVIGVSDRMRAILKGIDPTRGERS